MIILSINIEALRTKIKDIEVAIAIMQRIPPNAEELYQQSQTNLNKLQTRREDLSQLLEIELKVQQDIE